MAQKEYKELSCRDTGADCDFLVRAETEDEVISVASEHACRVHKLCEITAETKEKMKSMTRSVWCENGCASIREIDWEPPATGWWTD